ncbi:hypothetical protein [Nonomuraea sp. NPDC023979]|uniref:hypothetical protein n=1 Tax=Nonomuraea sp. NPDC023979 TaxID=3154796 RepID=UPI0033DB924F
MNQADDDHEGDDLPDSTRPEQPDLRALVQSEAFQRLAQPLNDQMRKSVQPHLEGISRSLTAAWADVARQLAPRAQLSSMWSRSISEALQPALTRWVGSLQPALASLREWAKERLPPNWDGADVKYDKIEEILFTDGIPLVWVPRADILSKLMAGATRDDRIAVLFERRDDVRADCLACLSPIDSPDLDEWVALARKAIAAWEDGHDEAAQTLATCVTEAVITSRIAPYKAAVKQAKLDWEHLTFNRLKFAAAQAPIVGFYTEWYPNRGVDPLATLSRHTTVHHPSQVQCNPENCTVAVMLLCSLLRAVHEAEAEQNGMAS